jgi:hypothetical protein
MGNPSSPMLLGLEYHLGLVGKQSKRIEELACFLPFAEQQKEMAKLMASGLTYAGFFPGLAPPL